MPDSLSVASTIACIKALPSELVVLARVTSTKVGANLSVAEADKALGISADAIAVVMPLISVYFQLPAKS